MKWQTVQAPAVREGLHSLQQGEETDTLRTITKTDRQHVSGNWHCPLHNINAVQSLTSAREWVVNMRTMYDKVTLQRRLRV
jgi:hypothetical protein